MIHGIQSYSIRYMVYAIVPDDGAGVGLAVGN
jgi:hypothetical protein